MKKKKLKIKLVKKTNLNQSSSGSTTLSGKSKEFVNLSEYHQFMGDFLQKNSKGDYAGCIREWYEKIFNEFPPWDKHPFELIKMKIQYELINRDYQQAKKEMPPRVKQNYEASKAFNIDGFTEGTQQLLRISLKHKKGDDDMGKVKRVTKNPKGKKPAPASKGESVTQSFERLFAENKKKKLNDTKLAAEMRKLHPNKKKYTEDDIRSVRSMYNRGKLSTQGNKKPKEESFVVGGEKPKKKVSASKSTPKKKGKLKIKLKKK